MNEKFIKELIEKMKEPMTNAKNLRMTNVLNDDILNSIDGPIEMIGYDLLKQICIIPSDTKKEEIVFAHFIEYIEGDSNFKNINELLKWIGEL